MATRYYRAPELVLMEKDYGKPVDVWAAGVVFGDGVGGPNGFYSFCFSRFSACFLWAGQDESWFL